MYGPERKSHRSIMGRIVDTLKEGENGLSLIRENVEGSLFERCIKQLEKRSAISCHLDENRIIYRLKE